MVDGSGSNIEWIEAFPTDSVAIGSARVVRHEGRQIAVFRLADGTWSAIDNRCPHEGYPLSQGQLCDGVLTCSWHNWKFSLADGSSDRGDAVTVHQVKEADGHVSIGVVTPDPAEEIERIRTSWRDAMNDDRPGQAIRDAVRLLKLGLDPEDIAAMIASYDAERGPWGIRHGAVTTHECLGFAEPGPQSMRALAVPLQLAMRSHIRRPVRVDVPDGTPIPAVSDVSSALQALESCVEAEQISDAHVQLRALLDAGCGRDVLEPAFWRLSAAHFLDFGHSAIYADGLFDFLDRVGWATAPVLLHGFLQQILTATREDVLPAWSRYRSFLADVDPTKFATQPSGAGWTPPTSIDTTRDALQAVYDALIAGERAALSDWLVDLATERLLRFDAAIDARSDCQDTWLSVTHCLTFAHAIRRGVRFDGCWTLFFQSARFSVHHRVLDGEDGAGAAWTPKEGGLDALIDAIDHNERQDAVDRAAWWVEHDRSALVTALRAWSLSDPRVRGIHAAHQIKTFEAAFRESSSRPLLAAVGYAASPVRERLTERRVHEALELVLHGRTPKLLAP